MTYLSRNDRLVQSALSDYCQGRITRKRAAERLVEAGWDMKDITDALDSADRNVTKGGTAK